jgi:hypothetical protein
MAVKPKREAIKEKQKGRSYRRKALPNCRNQKMVPLNEK